VPPPDAGLATLTTLVQAALQPAPVVVVGFVLVVEGLMLELDG
jgi:hypothetical protein